MPKSQEQRIEELSEKVSGRFALTALVQKRMRDYHLKGRVFMPRVRNVDELFELVLDQVESDEIRLRLPQPTAPEGLLESGSEAASEAQSEQ